MINEKKDSKILIVDDEAMIRKVLKKYLSEKGYFIETVNDGLEALEILEKESFDLVLTDLKMPQMSGNELLESLSKNYPNLPKIVLTGYGTEKDIMLALKTGAYDFLTKPITDFNILEHSIEKAIKSKKLNDEKNLYIDQLQQLNEIFSMLNKGKNTKDIFDSLNVTLKEIIPFNKLALIVLEKDDKPNVKLLKSDTALFINEVRTQKIDSCSLVETFENIDHLKINDLAEYIKTNPKAKNINILIEEGMLSSLILPLVVNNEKRGFLIFASKKSNVFKQEHITFLNSIVGQIALSIERGELLFENEKHAKHLEHLVDERTMQILKTQNSTIFALSSLAEKRDPETGDHLARMRNYSVLLAQMLKYIGNNKEITNVFLRDLYNSSILHDIGKVGIPDGILLKEGFLTKEEFEVMKTHSEIGCEALKNASKDLGEDSFLKMSMDITLNHHEAYDGSGYPNGLKGEEIPLSARIVTIADIYDALTTRRPYKIAFSHEESIKIMKENSEKYDPLLFKIFIDNSEEFNGIKKEFSNS